MFGSCSKHTRHERHDREFGDERNKLQQRGSRRVLQIQRDNVASAPIRWWIIDSMARCTWNIMLVLCDVTSSSTNPAGHGIMISQSVGWHPVLCTIPTTTPFMLNTVASFGSALGSVSDR